MANPAIRPIGLDWLLRCDRLALSAEGAA